VIIRTSGDVHTQKMPARLLGKGFFTKEIEDALLSVEVDLAVHSLKDLPTEWPEGLGLGATPPREDPRDALVGATVKQLTGAPTEMRIGTSSLRRGAQLRRLVPGCRVESLRGNIDTRLGKVTSGVVDCAVLAAAGLKRGGFGDRITDLFEPDQMLAAPGQGALALEVRSDDARLKELLQAVHCETTCACVAAERTFMHTLGGGCQLPVAALAVRDGETLCLRGRVLYLDGSDEIDGSLEGNVGEPEALGDQLARQFLDRGADGLIRRIEETLREEQGNG
jgi:hydroxymethylbilane synthase